MKMDTMDRAVCRELNAEEILLVAGGEEQEIVVTGTRMTDDQKLAYDMARAQAELDIFVLGALGVGTLAYFGAQSTLGAVLAAETGYVIGTSLDGEAVEQLTTELAESYYLADGADGTYDGVSDADRASPYPY